MITKLWSAEPSAPEQSLHSWVPGYEEQRLFNIVKQLKPGSTVCLRSLEGKPNLRGSDLSDLGWLGSLRPQALALLLSMPPVVPTAGRCDLLSSSTEISLILIFLSR